MAKGKSSKKQKVAQLPAELAELEMEDEDILVSASEDENEESRPFEATDSAAEEDEEDEEEIERQLVEQKRQEAEQTPAEKKQPSIYKSALLLSRAEELAPRPHGLPSTSAERLPWAETLDMSEFALRLEPTEVDDDLKREVAFYKHALENVKACRARLEEQEVPYKRPQDYFAEMIKSDTHMAKVKNKLIYEQKKIVAVEERKKSQEHKKIAKKVQSERLHEKAQHKKDLEKTLQQWKARDRKNGIIDDDDDDQFESAMNNSAKKRKFENGPGGRPAKKGKKREAKDKRFGFGGKKAGQKRNTRDSTNDMKGFSLGRNNAGVGKRGGGRGGGAAGGRGGGAVGGRRGGKGGNRPGKVARASNRGGKR